jgi:hypothetical protein
VKHLRDMHVQCARAVTVGEIFAEEAILKDREELIQKAIVHLGKMKARPQTAKALRSTVQNLFKELDESGVKGLLAALEAKRVLGELDGKIRYAEPAG